MLETLQFWDDLENTREAANQMATDEAMFLKTQEDQVARLRAYLWAGSAVTIGYFDTYPAETFDRSIIRRITGGGLVEHGEDLTFCITLPPGSQITRLPTAERYQLIHQSLYNSLTEHGLALTVIDNQSDDNGPCFSNPVRWDLADANGNKLVGGAQRKSKGAVIHQGSLRLPQNWLNSALTHDWLHAWMQQISLFYLDLPKFTLNDIEQKAQDLESSRYSSPDWNLKVTK